jgi:hypothetical protein
VLENANGNAQIALNKLSSIYSTFDAKQYQSGFSSSSAPQQIIADEQSQAFALQGAGSRD